MQIRPIIDDVYDGTKSDRSLNRIRGVMVHRVGIDFQTSVVLGYDAQSICEAFLGRVPRYLDVAKATGGENAYTFYVGGDCGPSRNNGVVWQALPIDEVGHHARRFSSTHIGIGCVGDFRTRVGLPPSSRQMASLVALTTYLCVWLGLPASSVVGHGEVDGSHDGSKAPGRRAACPGDQMQTDTLRDQVAEEIGALSRSAARGRLIQAGMRFPGSGQP